MNGGDDGGIAWSMSNVDVDAAAPSEVPGRRSKAARILQLPW